MICKKLCLAWCCFCIVLIVGAGIGGVIAGTRAGNDDGGTIFIDNEKTQPPDRSATCNEHGILPTYYKGDMAVTQTGLQCMMWSSQDPHQHGLNPDKEEYANKGLGHHNYCRNPDDEPNGAWCYTMDPKVRWEYCACCK